MLALIPVIGPSLVIATVACWEIIKLGCYVIGTPINSLGLGCITPWISLCVWALAF